MTYNFEAIITTSEATYRACAITPDAIAVTEDGVDGICDYIKLDSQQGSSASPEYLTVALRWWIYEHVRGIEILDTRLGRRA